MNLLLSQIFWPAVLAVTLDYGQFNGTTDGSTTIHLNIPYAAPPIGKRRFSPPQDPVSFDGVRQATAFGCACMQPPGSLGSPGLEISEDCLNLNVFAPANASETSQLPVLVYVIGGGFNTGYAANPLYDARRMIQADPRAVIVTFNYRLGAFGFLASQELKERNALNLGLLDQAKAFEWVRKYISHFGGDPSRMTAFGQSAGAISLGAHLTAKSGSQKLFDRAAMYSGAPLLQLPTVNSSHMAYAAFLESVGCVEDSWNCLMQMDSQILLNASNGTQFGPVIDGSYITEQTLYSYKTNAFSKVPLLMSSTASEGSIFTFKTVLGPQMISGFIESQFPFLNKNDTAQLAALYPPQYYAPPYVHAGNMLGDFLFQCPVLALSQVASAFSKVTLMQFTHEPAIPLAHQLKVLGAHHGSDIPFLWQDSEFISTDEISLSKLMLEALVDFAHGKQTTEFTTGTYLNLDNATAIAIPQSLVDRCQFWLDAVAR